MASILDYLIPQTMERQRKLARDRFAAGVAQPEIFKTDQFPLAELMKNYEKGYGIPYPTRPTSEPAPNLPGTPEHTQFTASNLPLEVVEPRTAMESAVRGGAMKGAAAAETDLSQLQRYGENMPRLEGFFQDVGEDIGDYDIPASLGGFQRPQPTEPGKSYGTPYFDERVGALLQREKTTGEVGKVAGRPGDGSGSSELDRIYDDALNTYKAIVSKAKLDPTTALMLQVLPEPEKARSMIEGYVSPQLNDVERRQLEQALQIMDYVQRQRRAGFKLGNLPMERDQADAATAESFLKKHLSGEGSTYQTPPFTGPMPKFPQYEIRKK